jgi:hypothetical protein
VAANVLHSGTLAADEIFVQYAVQVGGDPADVEEATRAMVPTGEEDGYEAFIPPQAGGSVVDYYIVAEDLDGHRAYDPKGAPQKRHRFIVGAPLVIAQDDFSTDNGWTVGDVDDDATLGIWVREAPVRSEYGFETIQPGWDHTAGVDSVCWVTGNATIVYTHSYQDVDGGKTTLFSPVFDLSSYRNAWVSYYRWYSNDSGSNVDDEWTVDVSNDGGQSWQRLETLAISERAWTKVTRHVGELVPLTSSVQFRFVADDSDGGSVVEGLVDDFRLVTYVDPRVVSSQRPRRVRMDQNHPNPFNPSTTIHFSVDPPGRRVTLRVYDVAGRLVTTILESEWVSGERAVEWDGRNGAGRAVASGVYFYDLRTPDSRLTRKMVVVR